LIGEADLLVGDDFVAIIATVLISLTSEEAFENEDIDFLLLDKFTSDSQ
jgi:hypothetical protein